MNKNTIKGVVLAAAIVSILSIFYTPISVFGDIIYNAKVVKQLWYPIGLASFILIIISLVYTSKLLVEQPELKVSWRLLLISLILQFSFAILYLSKNILCNIAYCFRNLHHSCVMNFMS